MLVSFDYQNKPPINKLADDLLKPARYLFAIDTIQTSSQIPLGESKVKHIFRKYTYQRTLPKTALAVAVIVPFTIFGIVLKFLSTQFSKENKIIYKEYEKALKDGKVDKSPLINDRSALIILRDNYQGSKTEDIQSRLQKNYKKVVVIKSSDFHKEKTLERIKDLGPFDFYALRKISQACYVFDAEGVYDDQIRDLYKQAQNSTVILFGASKNMHILEEIKRNQPDLQDHFIIESPLL